MSIFGLQARRAEGSCDAAACLKLLLTMATFHAPPNLHHDADSNELIV